MKGMVDTEMYVEIQKLKRHGYSQRAVAREKDISRTTVCKYWDMGEDEYAQYLLDSRSRTKLLDPYREYIVGQLEEHPEITSAIIDANLRCTHADFEPSYRIVRLYVANLREELGLAPMRKVRQFSEVPELPAGHQAQVDMGEQYTDENAVLQDLIESNLRQRGEIKMSKVKLGRALDKLDEIYGVTKNGIIRDSRNGNPKKPKREILEENGIGKNSIHTRGTLARH